MPSINLEIFTDLTPLETDLNQTVSKLRGASNALGNDMAGAFQKADAQAKKLDADLKKELVDLKSIEKQVKKNTESVDKNVESFKKITKETTNIQTGLSNLEKRIAGVFTVQALSNFIKEVINVRAEFQKFEAVLTNTLGSKSLAQNALKQIQQIAAETPFSVAELTASYVKLVNQGFEPTKKEIISLGDLAASQGKSFDQLTEAIIDAQTGEFERLKEFGIRASKEGSNVTFAFKGVKTQTEFTNQAIRDYILSLGELEGVSGGMAAISKTLGGQISNLGDNFDSLFNNIGQFSEQGAGGLLNLFNSILSTTNKVSSVTLDVASKLEGTSGQIVAATIAPNSSLVEFQVTLDRVIESVSNFKQESDFVDIYAKLGAALRIVNMDFEKGDISLKEYNQKLILLGKQVQLIDEYLNKLNNTNENVAQLGIIENLRKEISSLNKEREKALDITTINSLTAQIKSKEEELNNLLGKNLEKRKKLIEDFEKAKEDLRKRVEKAELENLDGAEKIELELKFNQQEIDLLEKHFIEVGKKTNSNFKLSLEQQEQFGIIRNSLSEKALDELIKIETDKQNELNQARLKAATQAADNLALQEQIDIGAVGLAPGTGLSQEEDLKQREIRKLEIKRSYVTKNLELQLNAINLEKELKENFSKEEQERLKLEGENAQVIAANTVNEIQNEIDKLNKKPPFDLAKLLGISNEALGSLKNSIGELGNAFEQILQQQIEQVDTILNASQQKTETYDQEIQSLQNKIKAEDDLNKLGRANNKSLIEQQISDLKVKQEKEAEIQQKQIEERKKIQKQQLLLDSITQASNLITSGTNIFLQATATGGPAGVPIAIAAISTMTLAFVASKLAAYKAINENPTGFKEGGYTGDKGTSDVAGVVHGQEFVHTAEKTKQHRQLFESIHSGDRYDYRQALLNELIGTGVSLEKELPTRINAQKSSIRNNDLKANFKQDNSNMVVELKTISSKFDEVLRNQKTSTYIDQEGNTVIKKGNNTIIIRKK